MELWRTLEIVSLNKQWAKPGTSNTGAAASDTCLWPVAEIEILSDECFHPSATLNEKLSGGDNAN